MADKKNAPGGLTVGGEVVIERADGSMEEIAGIRQEFSLLIHDESKQAFPIPPKVPIFTMSLDGPHSHLISEVYYFDEDLSNPDADPAMVFEVAEAACIAAERGELQEDQVQTNKARLNIIAAIGGDVFPIGMIVLSLALNQ